MVVGRMRTALGVRPSSLAALSMLTQRGGLRLEREVVWPSIGVERIAHARQGRRRALRRFIVCRLGMGSERSMTRFLSALMYNVILLLAVFLLRQGFKVVVQVVDLTRQNWWWARSGRARRIGTVLNRLYEVVAGRHLWRGGCRGRSIRVVGRLRTVRVSRRRSGRS